MEVPTLPLRARRLSEQIEGLIKRRTGGLIRDLCVEVAGEHVVLSGRAATYYAKQLAQHAAMDAAGSLLLVNEIEVA